jgi:uncharacterized protein YacL
MLILGGSFFITEIWVNQNQREETDKLTKFLDKESVSVMAKNVIKFVYGLLILDLVVAVLLKESYPIR